MGRRFVAIFGLITLSITLSACGKMQSLNNSLRATSLPQSSNTDKTTETDKDKNATPNATDPTLATTVFPPREIKNLVSVVIGASSRDLKIAGTFGLAPALSVFTFIEMLAPLALSLSASAINCMDFDIVSFARNDYDFRLNLSCPDVRGTIELKNNKDLSGNNYSLFMNTQTPDLIDNSQFTLTQSHDSLALRKTTDETFHIGSDTLRLAGSGYSHYTPSSGDYSLTQNLHFISNGDDLGSLTITANHLHSSPCGLDSGSFEISSGQTTIHVLVNSCGKTVITQDGLLVP